MADKIMKTLNGYEVYDEYARNKVSGLREEFSQLSSDEKIAEAVNAYMEANPVEGNVTVDTDLSETSTNPVQNKVVAAKFSQLSDTKADKDYLVTLFEDLKVAILAGDTETAIAILDSAILDLSTLG